MIDDPRGMVDGLRAGALAVRWQADEDVGAPGAFPGS